MKKSKENQTERLLGEVMKVIEAADKDVPLTKWSNFIDCISSYKELQEWWKKRQEKIKQIALKKLSAEERVLLGLSA